MIQNLVAKYPGQIAELWVESVLVNHWGLEPDWWIFMGLTIYSLRSLGQVTLSLCTSALQSIKRKTRIIICASYSCQHMN